MSAAIYNATAPQITPFHFNYYNECAEVLLHLERRRALSKNRILNLIDPQGAIFEKILNQAFEIHAQQTNCPVNIGWFQFCRQPKLVEVGEQLRHFLHEIRFSEDDKKETAFLKRVHSPWRKAPDGDDLYKRFILHNLTTISRRTCAIVIDLSSSLVSQSDFDPTVRFLAQVADTKCLANPCVFLITSEGIGRWQHIDSLQIEPVDPDVLTYLQPTRRLDLYPKPVDATELDSRLGEILTPLWYLNTGAEKVVIDYLKIRTGSSNQGTIQSLIDQGLARRLVGEGLALAQTSESLYRRILADTTSPYSSNVAKILSFRSPIDIALSPECDISFDQMQSHTEFALDAFALLIESVVHNQHILGNQLLDDIFTSSKLAGHLKSIAITRQKIMLSYLSQIILTWDELTDPRLFLALELMTEAYNSSLTMQQDAASTKHEAARSLYNLYYIMDRVSDRRPKLFSGYSHQDISETTSSYRITMR